MKYLKLWALTVLAICTISLSFYIGTELMDIFLDRKGTPLHLFWWIINGVTAIFITTAVIERVSGFKSFQ